jgi:hypothetical protein
MAVRRAIGTDELALLFSGHDTRSNISGRLEKRHLHSTSLRIELSSVGFWAVSRVQGPCSATLAN